MENSKENKFECNFCGKNFTCGKSLGGHIRIHKNEKLLRVAEKQKERASIVKIQVPTEIRRRSKRESESESGYGLRENPKIKKGISDSGFSSRQYKFCRECGEEFQSLDALFWHLDRHFEDERENKRLGYDYGVTHQKRKLMEDRSNNNSSKGVQAAAMSLIMMSRDLKFSEWEALHLVEESSDSKSSTSNNKFEVSECSTENSDSESFRKELCKKVKLKVSVNGPTSIDEKYKKDVKFGARIGRSDIQKNYDQVGASSYKYELRKKMKTDSYSPDLWESSSKKISSNGHLIPTEMVRSHHRNSHSRMSNGCEWTHTDIPSLSARELIESSSGKNKSHQDNSGNEEKKSSPKKKHKCPVCFKTFKSGQALGGHKRSHVVGSLENASIVRRQESNGLTGLIDLNVPAPMEDEESGRWG